MEINGKNLLSGVGGSVSRIDLDQRQSRIQSNGQGSFEAESDRIELSVRGCEIQHLDGLIRNTPDVRTEKVEQVRSAIENGTYNVKAEKIADKMITGGILDEIF